MPLEKTIKETALSFVRCRLKSRPDRRRSRTRIRACPRKQAQGSLKRHQGPLRLHYHRLPAFSWPIDDQRLNAASKTIVPIQGEYYAMEGLAQFLDAVQRIQQALNPNLVIEGGTYHVRCPDDALQSGQRRGRQVFDPGCFPRSSPETFASPKRRGSVKAYFSTTQNPRELKPMQPSLASFLPAAASTCPHLRKPSHWRTPHEKRPRPRS